MTDNHDDTATKVAPPSEGKKFFGHPRGLASLFSLELWERFSFYGMNSLLAFYLYFSVTDGGLGMPQGEAVSIVGAYGGFVYLSALAASFVSDRILGAERTLFYSAILVMAGHTALALLPGFVGLSIGLVCIGLGSGGVKTCASVVLGELYSRADPARDAGFSIFYLGVNIGALVGPALTPAMAALGGFHLAFGTAAIGMFIGLVLYVIMRRSYIGDAGAEVPTPLPKNRYLPLALATIAGIVIIIALLGFGILPLQHLSTVMAVVAFIAAVVLMIQMLTSEHTDAHERSRLIGFIPMLIGGVMFFAIFQSQFTILAVYAEQRLNRNFFGFELEPGNITLFNPLFIIIFSGVFATMWTKLGDRQWSTPVKFGVSTIIIGVSLFIFLPFTTSGHNGTPIAPIILILFLFTMAELLLSPVGNSLATKVAPVAFRSRTFAVWLMSVSMGTSLSGVLGALYDPNDSGTETSFFTIVGIVSVVIGLVLLGLRRWILKKFGDVR